MTPATLTRARGLPVRQLLLVLGLVATIYAVLLLVWGDSPKASLSVLWSWTGLQAGLLCVLNYVLRGLRWRLWMAHYGRRFALLKGLRLYLAGYAFTPTPGNVGEAVRGMMLAHQPLSTAQSLAIFGAERLADFLCLLLLCLPVAGWLLSSIQMRGVWQSAPALFGTLAALAAAMLAAVVWLLLRYRVRLLRRVPWLVEAWQCLTQQPLVWFGLSLVAWTAQGFAVWLLCQRLGVELSWLTASGFYALAMVVGALSALPAGLGGTEAVLTGLLVAHSALPAAALTLTVLARLLTLWLAVAIGVLALLYSAAICKDIRFHDSK